MGVVCEVLGKVREVCEVLGKVREVLVWKEWRGVGGVGKGEGGIGVDHL